ncbi:MAG: addiction module protein [Candidatus Schekmanbacteria bacterium]|nr:addiction module protein [Candidatus Schekmanbacteria bacterium]
MSITLPLAEMSIEEKIQTMETIWDDLCKKANSIPSPSWHKKILDERENGIKEGKDEFIDWSKAKESIRRKIS